MFEQKFKYRVGRTVWYVDPWMIERRRGLITNRKMYEDTNLYLIHGRWVPEQDVSTTKRGLNSVWKRLCEQSQDPFEHRALITMYKKTRS